MREGHIAVLQIDGREFAQPILVADASARRARVNDKVIVELVRFPSFQRDGEGVIVETLGRHNAPGVDTLSIIHEFNLPGEFPEDALEHARQQAERFDESIGDRLDLTQSTTSRTRVRPPIRIRIRSSRTRILSQ